MNTYKLELLRLVFQGAFALADLAECDEPTYIAAPKREADIYWCSREPVTFGYGSTQPSGGNSWEPVKYLVSSDLVRSNRR